MNRTCYFLISFVIPSDFQTPSSGVSEGNVLGPGHFKIWYISASSVEFGENIQSLKTGLNTSLRNITNWLWEEKLTLNLQISVNPILQYFIKMKEPDLMKKVWIFISKMLSYNKRRFTIPRCLHRCSINMSKTNQDHLL